MQMIRVSGRGIRSGVVTFSPQPGRLMIRVDDEENPEFWLTVELTEEQLGTWWRLVHDMEAVEKSIAAMERDAANLRIGMDERIARTRRLIDEMNAPAAPESTNDNDRE